jgi:predicted AAA+ superfamily ATPase
MNKINFWRTTNQTEIDFIVQGENLFEAIEIKWKDKKIPKSFATMNSHYPEIKTKVITALDFI